MRDKKLLCKISVFVSVLFGSISISHAQEFEQTQSPDFSGSKSYPQDRFINLPDLKIPPQFKIDENYQSIYPPISGTNRSYEEILQRTLKDYPDVFIEDGEKVRVPEHLKKFTGLLDDDVEIQRVINPGAVVNILLEQYKIQGIAPPSSLTSPSAVEKRNKCNSAVEKISKPRSLWGFASMVSGFAKWCLSGHKTPGVKPFNKTELLVAQNCFDAYNEYQRQCLVGTNLSKTNSVKRFIGVLTWRPHEVARRKIVCTAVLISKSIAITAQHCVKNIPGSSKNERWTYVAYDHNISEQEIAIKSVQLSTSKNVISLDKLREMNAPPEYKSEDDYAFLILGKKIEHPRDEKGLLLEFPKLEPKISYDKKVALIGWQPNVARLRILKEFIDNSQIIDQEDFLGKEAWNQGIRTEVAEHCRIFLSTNNVFSTRSFSHGCQSDQSTSGAPMFSVEDGEITPRIVALHTKAATGRTLVSGEQVLVNGGLVFPADIQETLVNLLEQEN